MAASEHWGAIAERAERLARSGDREACAAEAARLRADPHPHRRRNALILARLDAAASGVWWNSRYLAYCRAMGTPDPHERRALDGDTLDAAMWWVNDRWREWEQSTGRTTRSKSDHEAFDCWLDERDAPAQREIFPIHCSHNGA